MTRCVTFRRIFILIYRGLLHRERERMRGNQVRLEDKRDITETNLNKESDEERDKRSVSQPITERNHPRKRERWIQNIKQKRVRNRITWSYLRRQRNHQIRSTFVLLKTRRYSLPLGAICDRWKLPSLVAPHWFRVVIVHEKPLLPGVGNQLASGMYATASGLVFF